MDSIDIKILQQLQKNSDLTIQEISSLVHLSTTPCWKRINKLKKLGYVRKTVALLDNEKVGAAVTAFISITVNDHNQERIEIFSKAIEEMPEIIECYRMSGSVDYLLKILISDIKNYDQFYKKFIGKIHFAKVTSNFAIEKMKYSTEIPLNHSALPKS